MPRIFVALLILLFAGSILLVDRSRPVERIEDAAIVAESVPFDPSDPDRMRAGALEFLGGWVLTSADPNFGGISAMALDDGTFTAVGDAGGVFRFRFDPDGRIAGASIGVLPDGPAPEDGEEIRKMDRDAEALALDPRTGAVWIGFERANAIWRYTPALDAARAHHAPQAMEDWPSNGGAEALVRLADGRLIVFSEKGAGPQDTREALLFSADPASGAEPVMRFGFRPPEDYNVTDAAALPDGRLLILTRRFSLMAGVSITLCESDPAAIVENGILECDELATLAPPLTIDNMEALAIEEEDGRMIVWMASDDNFNPLQRTLLLKFALIRS